MKEFTAQDINVIYEDNHILVVVKPQNIPVCLDESGDKDLLTLCKEYLKEKHSKSGDAFLGLVHRLDRPTGGVMVFAKTSKAASRLAESMRDGEFQKKYICVTCGTPKEKAAELVHYLYKDNAKNTVFSVPMATLDAKKAILQYKVIDTMAQYALVEVKLITGRSHQIRVQMATIGTPLFGDAKYGVGKTPVGFNMALWATELRFPHPTTHEIHVYKVFPPAEETPWKIFDINLALALNIKS